MIWTQWDADHYALVDDGETMWVGSGSGLIRWDKTSGTYTRISTADGLPHRRVYSGAVDGAGNRWFGGDAGLSKLAKSGEWTHYDQSNSGIFSDNVVGIAVTADGSIWLSHAESSYVDRLKAEGGWALYPNRQTAVALAYETIKQTLNINKLWAAAGDEVWVDYDVFNGSVWQNRIPAGAYAPPLLAAADSENRVWVLEWDAVYSWDGKQWWAYPFEYSFGGEMLTLTIDGNDGVWVGGEEAFTPYSGLSIGYGLLPDKPGSFSLEHYLDVQPPIVALWPTDAGMWGTGPNWLLKPGGNVTIFSDAPYFTGVREAVVDRQGRTWISSGNYQFGALQTLDDMGTATMADDLGKIMGRQSIITVLEPAANGDLWVGWEWWFKAKHAGTPVRYLNNNKIEYQPPLRNGFVDDIFTKDGRHIWFAYSIQDYEETTIEKGVWSLDDGGTPADFADDVWVTYAMDSDGEDGVVAVVDDKLWFGDSSGLYLYRGAHWEKVSSGKVRGLVPGPNGVLFVDENWRVLIIEKDGRQSTTTFEDLIARDFARVQATERRNQMWTVAADGAVWYWQSRYDHELARRDEQGLDIFTTAAISDYVEVDDVNHVWLADGALWRMSPEPDFTLEIGPAAWFLTTNDSRIGQVQIKSNEGYEGMVDLTIGDLPEGIRAEITPQQVSAGETAALILTTENRPLGQVTVIVNAVSGPLSRQASLRLSVAETVGEILAPVLLKGDL